MKAYFLLCISVLMIMACGFSDDLSGNASETTNGIAGMITYQDTPLAAASVYLLDSVGTSLDTTETDDLGKYKFEAIATAHYGIYAISKDSSITVFVDSIMHTDGTVTKVDIMAEEDAVIQGRASIELPPTESFVLIDELGVKVPVDETGAFDINGIAEGTWKFDLVTYYSGNSKALLSSKTIDFVADEGRNIAFTERDHPFETGSFLMDDFEATDNKLNKLGKTWFIFDEGSADTNTVTGYTNGLNILNDVGGYNGSEQSASIKFTFGTGEGPSYSGFGFYMGVDGLTYAYDMRSVTGVRFAYSGEPNTYTFRFCLKSDITRYSLCEDMNQITEEGWRYHESSNPSEWIHSQDDKTFPLVTYDETLKWTTQFIVVVSRGAATGENTFRMDDLEFVFE